MSRQVQRRLEMNFPVCKNTRLRSKAKVVTEKKDEFSENVKPVTSPRKRTEKVCDENVPLSCSPKKKTKPGRTIRSQAQDTPIKTSLITKYNKNSPVKVKDDILSCIPLSSPLKKEKEDHSKGCLSVTKIKCVQSPYRTEAEQFGKLALTSPKICRNQVNSSSQNLSSSRPCPDSLERLPLSPSKRHNVNDQSPVKAKQSPVRRTDSPSKRQLFAPCVSPRKSPLKITSRESVFYKKASCFGKENSRSITSPSKGNVQDKGFSTPKRCAATPRLKSFESPAYQLTKKTLHTAKPDRIDCREKEVGEIREFLSRHLKASSGGSLYISGAPGTGKTASLHHIIDDLKETHACKIAYLNCMMLKDSHTVFSKLHEELSGSRISGRKDVTKCIEKLVTASKHSIVMVLDEIDQLDSKNQEILYTVFEWPSLKGSKLVLVGIANALDLTDRILPRLQARPNCRPQLLNFAPYSKEQIVTVIKGRLSKLEKDGLAVIEPSALQFCARKISAVAGDMRKALDVCHRAVELVEHEIRIHPEKYGLSSNGKVDGPIPKITVAHISRIMSEVYGSSVKASSHEETVPLQQKLAVCTLLLMLKEGKFKEVTLGKLHETYCKVCQKQQVVQIDQSEFFGLCLLLEARGIFGVKKSKESRLAKVILKLDEKELEHTLKDRVLISAILQGGIPK